MEGNKTTKRFCQACIFQRAGVRTHRPIPHVCGKDFPSESQDVISINKGDNSDLHDVIVRKSLYIGHYAPVLKSTGTLLPVSRELAKNKILIIGQAPAAQKQQVPYDTTMLYDWLVEIGINKKIAQSLFDFDAVFGEFPGYDENGGHKVPDDVQMKQHYDVVLKSKIEKADRIIILGKVAEKFLNSIQGEPLAGKKVIYLIHPSKRNFSLYQKSKENILTLLSNIVYDYIVDDEPSAMDVRDQDTGD